MSCLSGTQARLLDPPLPGWREGRSDPRPLLAWPGRPVNPDTSGCSRPSSHVSTQDDESRRPNRHPLCGVPRWDWPPVCCLPDSSSGLGLVGTGHCLASPHVLSALAGQKAAARYSTVLYLRRPHANHYTRLLLQEGPLTPLPPTTEDASAPLGTREARGQLDR